MLIDDALATIEAALPIKLGQAIPLSLNESIVNGIYDAVLGHRTGLGSSEAEIERNIRLARRAEIGQDEIDAAIAAAERDAVVQ